MSGASLHYEKVEWKLGPSAGESKDDTFDFKELTTNSDADAETEQVVLDHAFSSDDTSDNSYTAMEELTIAHEYIERQDSADVPTCDDLIV